MNRSGADPTKKNGLYVIRVNAVSSVGSRTVTSRRLGNLMLERAFGNAIRGRPIVLGTECIFPYVADRGYTSLSLALENERLRNVFQ
jgi:hypothetical protein